MSVSSWIKSSWAFCMGIDKYPPGNHSVKMRPYVEGCLEGCLKDSESNQVYRIKGSRGRRMRLFGRGFSLGVFLLQTMQRFSDTRQARVQIERLLVSRDGFVALAGGLISIAQQSLRPGIVWISRRRLFQKRDGG